MKTRWGINQPISSPQLRRCVGMILIFSWFSVRSVTATVYMNKHCHSSVSSDGDIIKSQDTLYYKPNSKCEIILMTEGNGKILLQILDMDIISSGTNCHTSYLEVFPVTGSSNHFYLCSNAAIPPLITSEDSYLRLRLVNHGVHVGRGFYGVFTTIYPADKPLSCRYPEYYHCSNGYCISHDLTCDTVDHCGDNSDENPSLCKEEVYRWMELSKGPISVVEIVFTLIGLGIIITVVIVVIFNCCIDLRRKRHQSYDLNDNVLGKNLLRKHSVSYHPAGTRVPLQRIRSTSIDFSARTATQEDLQYLQKMWENDSVFEDSDPGSNSPEVRRKISVRREKINQEIEEKVQDINRNNFNQTEKDSPYKEQVKGKLPRRVSFDDRILADLKSVSETDEPVIPKQKTKRKLQRAVSFEDDITPNFMVTVGSEEALTLLQQPITQQERSRRPGVIMEHDEAVIYETEI